MSSQIIQVQSGQNNVAIGKAVVNSLGKVAVSRREFNKIASGAFTSLLTDLGPGVLMTAPVNLNSITEVAQIASITPGFAGRLSAAFAVVTTAVSTGSKAANIGVWIDQVPGTNEVQRVTVTGTPTGGDFTLTYAGQTTVAIAHNAAAATVQSALEGLSNISVGDVTCAGGALPGAFVTVTFSRQMGGADIAEMTATSSLTGGTTPAVAVTTTTPGTSGSDSLVATATSGGVIALTSANATPAGTVVPGSRIAWSAANPMDFGASSVISFRPTATPTTFSEGAVMFGLIIDAPPTVSSGTGPLLT